MIAITTLISIRVNPACLVEVVITCFFIIFPSFFSSLSRGVKIRLQSGRRKSGKNFARNARNFFEQYAGFPAFVFFSVAISQRGKLEIPVPKPTIRWASPRRKHNM
jgi:hypothetical protein